MKLIRGKIDRRNSSFEGGLIVVGGWWFVMVVVKLGVRERERE